MSTTLPSILTPLIAALGIGVSDGKVSQKFTAEDPLLFLARTEQRQYASVNECRAQLRKLATLGPGVSITKKEERLSSLAKAWAPWSSEDDAAIEGCASFPCQVKLSAAEVARLSSREASQRKLEFEKTVLDRLAAYEKTGKRLEYEFPGDPVDPWYWIGKKVGFSFDAFTSGKPEYYARKLVFGGESAPERLKPLRQVLDVRRHESADRFSRFVRDAYTAHYFDGWGEWLDAECESGTGRLIFVQTLFVEFDLLKKTDLLSRLSRSRMRQAIEKNGAKYLEAQRDELFGQSSPR